METDNDGRNIRTNSHKPEILHKLLPEIPKPQDRDNADLLELVLQLHTRAVVNNSESVHIAYQEARKELESRFARPEPIRDEEIEREMLQYERSRFRGGIYTRYDILVIGAKWMRDRIFSRKNDGE